PPIELPQIKIAWAKVVVNDIHEHADSALMCGFHKPFQSLWPPVIRFHCEQMRWVVAPTAIPGEFGNWHDLNDIHAQSLQIVEFFDGRLKRSDPVVFPVAESTYVHLVNHYLVDRRK